MSWFTPTRRRWLYDTSTAVALALGTFGLLSDDKVQALIGVFGAVTYLARRNVNDEPDSED